MPHIQDIFNVLITFTNWNHKGPIHLGHRTVMVDEFLGSPLCGTFI